VLLKTLGRDVPVTFTSESTPHLTREYKSLTAAAKEVGGERGMATLLLQTPGMTNHTHRTQSFNVDSQQS
jgi:hypothetical protein